MDTHCPSCPKRKIPSTKRRGFIVRSSSGRVSRAVVEAVTIAGKHQRELLFYWRSRKGKLRDTLHVNSVTEFSKQRKKFR